MTNIWKRSMAMLLALVMVLGMVPVGALAAETEQPVETAEAVETTEAATEEAAEAPEETAQETSSPETTAAVETEGAEETEPVVTEAQETEAPETEPVVTEPQETVLVESEPAEVEATEEALNAAIDSIEMLQAALDEAAAAGKSTYLLQDDITVLDDATLTIPMDMSLDIDGAALIVTGDTTLTITGQPAQDDEYHEYNVFFYNRAELKVEGKLVLTGDVFLYAQGIPVNVEKGAELNIMASAGMYVQHDAALEVLGTVATRGGGLNIMAADKGEGELGTLNIYPGGQLLLDDGEHPVYGNVVAAAGGSGVINVYAGGKIRVLNDVAGLHASGFLYVEDFENDMVLNGTLIEITESTVLSGVPNEACEIQFFADTQETFWEYFSAVQEAGYGRVSFHAHCDLDVAKDLTIPQNFVLYVYEHYNEENDEYVASTVQVAEGVTLTIAGNLYLSSNAVLDAQGDVLIQERGHLVVSLDDSWNETNSYLKQGKNSTIVINGGFQVNEDGIAIFDGHVESNAFSFWNRGGITLNGTMCNNETINNNGDFVIAGTLTNEGTWLGNDPVLTGNGKIEKEALTQDKLEEELAKAAEEVGYYRLNKPVTIDRDLKIKNVNLWIGEGGHMTVTNKATLTVEQEGYAGLGIENGGKLDVESGSKLVNNSWIQVTDWGETFASCLNIQSGATYSASEYANLEVKAELRNDQLYTPTVQGIDRSLQTLCFYESTQKELVFAGQIKDYAGVTLYTTDMTVTGNVTVGEKVTLFVAPFEEDNGKSNLVVTEGAVLTVDGTLTVQTYTYSDGSGNETERKAVLENNGRIIVNGTLNMWGTLKGNEPEVPAMSQADLEELLKNPNEYGWVFLTQKVTLEKDLALKVNLALEAGGELVVPKGKTLTVNKDKMIDIRYGSKLDIQGKLVNNGGVYANSGGSLNVDGTYSGNGSLEAMATLENGYGVTGAGIDDKDLCLSYHNLEDQEAVEAVAEMAGEYAWIYAWTFGFEVEGDLTIPQGMNLVIAPHNESGSYVDGVLVIPEDSTVDVHGELQTYAYEQDGEVRTSAIANAGTLILNEGSSLYHGGIYSGKLPVMNGGTISQNEPKVKSVTIVDEDGVVEATERQNYVTLTVKALAEEDEHYRNAIPAITWTSSDKTIVDPAEILDNGDGTYTAPIKGDGSVKLTATAEYANKKYDTVTVKVIPVCPTELTMLVDGKAVTDYALAKSNKPQTFAITLKAEDEISEFLLKADDVKWTSSDTSLAAVEPMDGGARVTVAAGGHGVAAITATVKDEYGAQATLTLAVQDFSPRLDGEKVTLDAMTGDTAYVPLTGSYGNEITDIKFASAELNKILNVGYDAILGSMTLSVRGDLAKMPANGTYSSNLVIETAKGVYKDYPFTVTIKSTVPSVTIKQPYKLDLLVAGNGAELDLTSKNGDIVAVEVVSRDFQMAYYYDGEPAFGELVEGGQYVILEHSQDYIDRAIAAAKPGTFLKPDTKVTLKLYVEGYAYPVEKEITLKTTTSKLNLVTNPGSSSINTELGENIVSFKILHKGSDYPLYLEGADIKFEDAPAKWWMDENYNTIFVQYDAAEKRNETIYIRPQHMLQYVKVTHKVSVSNKLPAVKLGSSTITISKPVMAFGYTSAVLDQGNIELAGMDFATTAKEGSAAWDEAEKVELFYDNGIIGALIADENLTPKNGSYSFKATPYVMVNGARVDLKTVTVKIKIEDLKPKYKLSATTLKLNTDLAGKEVAVSMVSPSDNAAMMYEVVGFEGMDAHKEVALTYGEYNWYTLAAKLNTGAEGKYAYELHPIVLDENGEEVTLKNVTLKLTVQAYNGDVSVKQSGKGKLDALNPESQILYTVSKITNSTGEIEKVELTGTDKNKFQLTGLGYDAKGKQTFGLTLKEGVTYSTKQSYKVRFKYTLDSGATYTSPEVKVKVTQGALKVKAPKVTYYLSQSLFMAKLDITAPENAAVKSITLNTAKTNKDLLKALGDDVDPNMLYSQGDMYAWIRTTIQNPGALKVGKTYKLVLDIVPEGQTVDGKTTQVTVSIKIAK